MTEPIMINGVDVSGCLHFNECNGTCLLRANNPKIEALCKLYSDCYCKRYQRKTAEYEEYAKNFSHSNAEFEQERRAVADLAFESNKYREKLQREKQTNTELNKQLEKLVDEKYKLNEQLSSKTAECEKVTKRLEHEFIIHQQEEDDLNEQIAELQEKLQIATEALENYARTFNCTETDCAPCLISKTCAIHEIRQALERIKE